MHGFCVGVSQEITAIEIISVGNQYDSVLSVYDFKCVLQIETIPQVLSGSLKYPNRCCLPL